MKMKKFNVFLVFSFLFSTALHAQPITSEQTNFIKRQYNSFIDDVKLIRKCYLKKTPACSDNERAEANKAVARVTAKGLAVVGAILVTAVGTILVTAAVGYGDFYGVSKYVPKKKKVVKSTFEPPTMDVTKKANIILAVVTAMAQKDLEQTENYKEKAKDLINQLESQDEMRNVHTEIFKIITGKEPENDDEMIETIGTYFGWTQEK